MKSGLVKSRDARDVGKGVRSYTKYEPHPPRTFVWITIDALHSFEGMRSCL